MENINFQIVRIYAILCSHYGEEAGNFFENVLVASDSAEAYVTVGNIVAKIKKRAEEEISLKYKKLSRCMR